VTRGKGGSALDSLLDAATFGQRMRHAAPVRTAASDDWTAAQLTINTVRKYRTLNLKSEAARVRLSDEVTLIKPEGFAGEVTITALGLATRGTEGDPGLRPPPGLEAFSDLFAPLGHEGTRSIGRTDVVIGIEADEASRRLITPANPIRLELPTTQGGDVADLVPVIFDGEDYLLAGYGAVGGGAVDIVDLPSPSGIGGPTTRGIGRTLRLFVYKRLARAPHDRHRPPQRGAEGRPRRRVQPSYA
jgi:hypothetical protein